MGFELNEIGATLAVGVYCLIGLTVLGLFWRPAVLPSLLARLSDARLPVALLGGIVAFAFGIFMERISNYIADEFPGKKLILPEDQEIRARVFYEKFDEEYARQIPKLEKLGLLTADAAAKELLAPDPAPGADPARAKRRVRLASLIYYEAKSAVFGVETYYADLLTIQTHIRFVRSFAVVSFLLVAAGAFILLLRGLLARGGLLPLPAAVALPRYWKHGAMFLLVFALLWGVARASYTLEEELFDARVFGYYLHLLRKGP